MSKNAVCTQRSQHIEHAVKSNIKLYRFPDFLCDHTAIQEI